MYAKFYGLEEPPFNPTPEPKFLFQAPRHREALAQLLYGVGERKAADLGERFLVEIRGG